MSSLGVDKLGRSIISHMKEEQYREIISPEMAKPISPKNCPKCLKALCERFSQSDQIYFCEKCGLMDPSGSCFQPSDEAIRREMAVIAYTLKYLFGKTKTPTVVVDYAKNWAEIAAKAREQLTARLTPQDFGLFERDFLYWWTGRKCTSLDLKTYVGAIKLCPLWEAFVAIGVQDQFAELHEVLSKTLYETTYALLGYSASYEVLQNKATRLTLNLEKKVDPKIQQ